MIKVNVVWGINDISLGGGNQFLRRLKDVFVSMGCYAEPQNADVFLFNSHHETETVINLRTAYPNKKFFHRIDGPIRLYNNPTDERDDVVLKMNEKADGVIFQSHWSKESNIELYPKLKIKPSVVIHNACDVNVKKKESEGKTKIVAASVSDNVKKGYDIYSYMDNNLDFDKYDFTFIGRSPVPFKNINDVGLKSPDEVLSIFSEHDIYMTASQNDPCSNSLTEALSVGLPALALNSGGHPELVKGGGILFNNTEDVLSKLEKVVSYRDSLEKGINVSSMTQVALWYLGFFMSW